MLRPKQRSVFPTPRLQLREKTDTCEIETEEAFTETKGAKTSRFVLMGTE